MESGSLQELTSTGQKRVQRLALRTIPADAGARWSLNAPDVDSSFEHHTITQPNLAHGTAIYGGTDITVRNNLIADTNTLGSRAGAAPGGGHLPERLRDRRRPGRRLQLSVPGGGRHLPPHRRRRQLRLGQHLVRLLHLAPAGRAEPRPGPDRDLALGRPAAATGSQDVYAPGKAVDGAAHTCGESANHALPQSLTIGPGATRTVRRVVLRLPPQAAWQARARTLSVQGSTDGSSCPTLTAPREHRFAPATGNTVTVPVDGSLRPVRWHVTGSTGWPAARCAEVEVCSS